MATSSTFGTSNQYVKYNITVNVNSQNITNNTSNVTVTVRFWRTNVGYETYGSGSCYCWIETVGAQTQSVTPSQKIINSGINLFSWTGNIPHNSDGTKSIWVSSYINLNTPLTSNDQGFTASLPTIPRASSASGGSGNIGSTSTISISRASSSFDHILYYSFGSISWRWIASGVGTSYTWTLPSDLYGQIPNANSGIGTLICETYSSGTYIGTSYSDFTANVTNSNPVFTASQLTYKDTNSDIVNITQNNQLVVRNLSTLQAVFTAATAKNSATINKYQIIFNGATQEKTAASTINYGLVNLSQNTTLQIKAIDSRGNSTTISKTVQILDYVPPIIIATAQRINNFENETILKADVTVSSVDGLNSLQTLKYQLQKIPDGQWSEPVEIPNNSTTHLILDNLFAWNLEILATDKFDATAYGLIVAKGQPIMFFDTKKLSVGVNSFPKNNSSLETVNFLATGNSKMSGKDIIFTSGIWIPTPISTATSPTYSVEYRYARYYRINSLVYVTFHMKFNITNAGSGYAKISGLPYVAGSGNNSQGLAIREMSINTSGINNACAYVLDGTSQIQLSNGSGIMAQAWANGTSWIGLSGFYLIDTL